MSPKENKIVKLLLRGYEYKEISHMLAISINTLKPYINKIYKRFKVHNKVELINLIQEHK
jgi:DNA-binding CsgD family transcriptional regulator